MPQVGGHITVASLVKNILNDQAPIDANPEAYLLGSIGPDLELFLFDPLGESRMLNEAVKVLGLIRDFKEIAEEITDKVNGPVEDFTDWVTGGLSTQVFSLIGTAFEALKTQAATAAVPGGGSVEVDNPFAGLGAPGIPDSPTITVSANELSEALRRFGHPYTEDSAISPITGRPYKKPEPPGEYKNWWWIDLLHYRRTGEFTSFLLGQTDPLLKAYGMGYATHVAADVCGHPYVNAVVGGPFRNHVMRHMVQENIIDAWIWNHYHQEDIINSCLHKKVDVGGDFARIAEMLISGMDKVFVNADKPIRPSQFPDRSNGLPSTQDMQRAYNLMLMYLELSTDTGLSAPVPPPSNPQEFFQEIAGSLGDTANSIGEQFSSDNEWWEWLLAPFLAAAYALVLLFKLLTLPAGVLTRAIALAPRWYAYMLEVALYDFMRNARWTLCLGGWGKPSSEDLSREFAQISYHIPPGRSGTGALEAPFAAVSHDVYAFWLRDPALAGASIESPASEISPYVKEATPEVFIDGTDYCTQQDNLLKAFGGIQGDANPSPFITHSLQKQTFTRSQFGGAVGFAKKLIEGSYPLTSFDLDGDRGYGYLGWEAPASNPVYRKDLWDRNA